MHTKLTVAYHGGPFAGWAAQPGRRTVAGELSRALETVLRAPVALTAAGRTDAGVHALGQVVSLPGPPPAVRSVNTLLPYEIAVLEASAAPDGFSARYDAVSRTYAYRILARRARSPFEQGRALWWPRALDVAALEACAAALAGARDFTAFTPTETRHRHFVREVRHASWTRADGDVLVFRIEADSFLRHMNRVLVGTMLEVGSGRRSAGDFTRLLRGRPRSQAGATAPPHGLYLESVRYPPPPPP